MMATDRKLTHVDARGRIRMVDVGHKAVTAREAVARGTVSMSATAVSASISTPVCAEVRARASIAYPPRDGVISTATCVNDSG